MPPRFHIPAAPSSVLTPGALLPLPPGAARHAQVLRLQPGDEVTLFDGTGGQWSAHITRMGRRDVEAQLHAHNPVEREAARAVHLAVGLMAADRMDWLVEKATELGAASVQPLLAERSSLRLNAERAQAKRAHWHAVAIAASEQSGRNRLLEIRGQLLFQEHLRQPAAPHAARWLLSLDAAAPSLGALLATLASGQPVQLLSGPEGGLSAAEQAAALSAGYRPVSLGPRVLRAETAPLAALAALV
jgi:16S rRNA (uracil1498-N3)-methyltransferase